MFNKSILIGRLTAIPELKVTRNGISVIAFTLACDRKFSKDGKKEVDFINCVAWRQTAEFISKYFDKGAAIGVEGSIQTRNYEDKNGNKRTAVEVAADSVFFVSGKNDGRCAGNTPQGDMGGSQVANVDYEEVDEGDSDLPF